jgi:hypothetical protein
VNGEQIIGGYNPDGNQVKIDNPFYIIETQDEFGNNVMKLINVCTFSKEQCIIVNDKHIVFSVEANNYMIRYYEKLVEAYNHSATSKMIEEVIKEMDDMEEKMRNVISKRRTIN